MLFHGRRSGCLIVSDRTLTTPSPFVKVTFPKSDLCSDFCLFVWHHVSSPLSLKEKYFKEQYSFSFTTLLGRSISNQYREATKNKQINVEKWLLKRVKLAMRKVQIWFKMPFLPVFSCAMTPQTPGSAIPLRLLPNPEVDFFWCCARCCLPCSCQTSFGRYYPYPCLQLQPTC